MWNPEILKIIEKSGYELDDILVYLLTLHHKLKPTYVPEIVKKQTNVLGIINRDFDKSGTIEWIVPLFKPNAIDDNSRWDWVLTEYRILFMNIDSSRGGDKKSCIIKMQKYFAANPDVRKDDVLQATRLYLEKFTSGTNDAKFMIHADYFINKSNRSVLAQHIEMLVDEKLTVSKRHKGLQNY